MFKWWMVTAWVLMIISCFCSKGQSQPGRSSNGSLDQVRKLYAEKSYQMAIEAAESVSTATLDAGSLHELQYLTAMSLAHQYRQNESRDRFKDLTAGTPEDAWVGRAHWRLQYGLPPFGYQVGEFDTSKPLHHLRQADGILAKLKTDDLREFYTNIVQGIGAVPAYTKEERSYVFEFFDKLIAISKTPEDIAEAHLLRARNINYVDQDYKDHESRIKALRQIVQEFPETEAAAEAQWDLGRWYADQGDLLAAVYELTIATKKFPGKTATKQAIELLAEIKSAQVQFRIPAPVLPDSTVSFTLVCRNTGDVKITAVPFDPLEQLKQQTSLQLSLKGITGPSQAIKTVHFDRTGDYKTTSQTVTFKAPAAGVYALRAEADGAVCIQCLLVSNLVLVNNQSPQALEFWAVDAETGKPRNSIKVTVASEPKEQKSWFDRTPKQKYSRFTDLVTSADGFADFTVAPPSGTGGQVFAIARDGDNIAFLDGLYWNPGGYGGRDGLMAYMYTDRPVYRPDQKAGWRAIIRDRKDGKYRQPDGVRIRAEITDPKGAQILKQENLQPNEFGSVSGDVVLPAGCPLGAYQLSLFNMADGAHIGGESFRVEEYKKPEYEVIVKAGKSLARAGEALEANISARYYFGAPVADADVQFTVKRRPKYWLLTRWLYMPLGDEDLGWFDADPSPDQPRHNTGGDIVASGTGKTDKDGKFVIKFDAKIPPKEESSNPRGMNGRFGRSIWPWWQPNMWDFQIEATVTDKSRRNIDGTAVITAGDKALQLGVKSDRCIAAPGDLIRAELIAQNLSGDPVAAQGTLYVEKLKWNPAKADVDITTVSTTRVDIGVSGTLRTEWRIPEGEIGSLRFLLVADDPYGGKSTAAFDFTSASPDTRDIHVRYQGVQIVADKTLYEIGDTARLMVTSEFTDAYAWFWINAGSGNLEKRVVPLKYRTNFLEFPITDAFVPNNTVQIVAVRDNRIIQDSVELIVPPRDQVLNVRLESSKPDYKPGEEGVFTVHATGHDGKPVRAEFSLSAFDRSVLYIAGDTRVDIRKLFYGERRQTFASIGHSVGMPWRYQYSLPENPGRFLINTRLGAGNWDEGDLAGRSEFYLYDGVSSTGRGGGRQKSMRFFAQDAMRPASAPPAPVMMAAEVAATGAVAGTAFDAAKKLDFKEERSDDKQQSEALAPAAVRSDFRDSIYWSPAVVTDAQGSATVRMSFPDSLTTWKCVTVGTTPDTRVGQATTETETKKNLLARLQTPRFFRERDEVTLSGIVHNYLDKPVEVKISLKTGKELKPATSQPLEQTVTIEPGHEFRADWDFRAVVPGTTSVTLTALSSVESDAMEMSVPVLVHGMDKFVAWNGSTADTQTSLVQVTNSGNSVSIKQGIELPSERVKSTSRLTVVVNPSLAFAIRDALPYMIEYPYGCVEQTMSRFMPAAVAHSAFQQLNFPPEPSLSEKLPEVIRKGIQRLTDFQHSDGSWGWWRDDDSNIYMTAYVMYGFTVARQGDVSVDSGVFSRGLNALRTMLAKEKAQRAKKPSGQFRDYWWHRNLNEMMFGEFVMSLNGQSDPETVSLLWERREELSAHALAMLARTLWHSGRQEDARTVLRNLHNVAVETAENQTTRWGRLENCWYWWDGAVEATAMGVMAYLEIAPDDPVIDRAVKWLVLNREGNRWKSTKDSARAVLALAEYMRAKKEVVSDMSISVRVEPVTSAGSQSGAMEKTYKIDPSNFWQFTGRMTLEGDAIPESADGKLAVTITRTGKGTAYYSVFAEYFTLEEDIKKAGNEIYVERSYEKLVREKAGANKKLTGKPPATPDPTVESTESYVPLKPGDPVQSGDEIRVSLKIKSLNNYEYLIFEDPKPAGMEPVAVQSGGTWQNGFCSNMELRDQHVAFFITYMPQGDHVITYNVRAEIPGTFHTMPTKGYAMYYPPLRTNSDELVIKVIDKD